MSWNPRRAPKKTVLSFLFGLGLLLYSLGPLLWALLTSLKSGEEIYTTIWPVAPTLDNYWHVLQETALLQNLWNSTLVASGTVLTGSAAAVLAVYMTSRHQNLLSRSVLILILFVSCFPQIAVLSGLFQLLKALEIYNSRTGLIVSYWVLTIPFLVWSLHSFAKQVPRNLEEAARIDGAGEWTLLTRIFLPLLAPGLLSSVLLAFVFAWNEFLFAVTFTLTDETRTVPVAISTLSGASQFEVPWGSITAASLIVTLPVVCVFLAFQRKILEGLSHAQTAK